MPSCAHWCREGAIILNAPVSMLPGKVTIRVKGLHGQVLDHKEKDISEVFPTFILFRFRWGRAFRLGLVALVLVSFLIPFAHWWL